ncbi:hypothetical protein MRX96_014362 [Rhipicephalus microplus]
MQRRYNWKTSWLLWHFCILYLGKKTLGSVNDKQILKAEIVAAVYQAAADQNLPEFFKHLVSDEGETLDEDTVIQRVDEIFRAMEALRISRNQIVKYRSILEEGNLMQPAVYKPLLKQVLEDIFDPNVSEAPQLDYHSGGLSNMLKAGFGLFRSTSKPLPRDSPVLIVFIIGGVTASEVKLVNDITSSRKLTQQVIVGSTTLAKPHQQLNLLLGHSV